MANEVTSATLASNGGLVAEVLGPAIRATFDASDISRLFTEIPWTGAPGSTSMQIPVLPAAAAFSAFSSEAAPGISPSAYTTGKRTLTVAGYGIAYNLSDLAQLSAGPVNVDELAMQIAQGLGLALTDVLAALFAGASQSVGTSGAALTADDIYDAIALLRAGNVSGPMACVLYPKQISNLIESIRSEGGVAQFRSDSAAATTAQVGPGFQFSFAGVDFYQSDSCVTANAGADSVGALFVPGAIGWSVANPMAVEPQINPADVLLMSDMLYIERVRNGANRQTAQHGTAYLGAVELKDECIIKIVTDR